MAKGTAITVGRKPGREIQVLSRAEKLLVEAQTIDEIRHVENLAQRARDYAVAANLGASATNQATKVMLAARRRAGETLLTMRERGELAKHGGDRSKVEGVDLAKSVTLKDLQLSGDQASHYVAEAKLPEAKVREWIAEVEEKAAAGKDAFLSAAALRKIGREPKAYEPEEPDFDAPEVSCMSWDKWLPHQPECDLLFTDPPYMTDVEDVAEFAAQWLPDGLLKVKDTGRAYVCIGAYPDELHAYLNIEPPSHLVLEQVLVWTYRNTLGQNPSHKYKLNWQAILYYLGKDAPPLTIPKTADQFSVFDINAPDGRLGDRCHTWQKPDKLANIIIQQATREGELVLDPFCCTGTFLLAANRFGRIGHGCDIDQANLDIAIKRGCVDAL